MNTPKIKGIIAEAGYSQARLAREMNLSTNALNLKINGKKGLYLNEAKEMCKILKIPPDLACEIFLQ